MSFFSKLVGGSSSSSGGDSPKKSKLGIKVTDLPVLSCLPCTTGDPFPESILKPLEHQNAVLTASDVRVFEKLSAKYTDKLSLTLDRPMPEFLIPEEERVSDSSATMEESTGEEAKVDSEISGEATGEAKYSRKIARFGQEFLIRYVTGYAHISDENERIEKISAAIDDFMESYLKYRFDLILDPPTLSGQDPSVPPFLLTGGSSSSEDASKKSVPFVKIDPALEARMTAAWPTYYYGFDKFGHPIYYDRIGEIDVKGLNSILDDTKDNYDVIFQARFKMSFKLMNLQTYMNMKYQTISYKSVVIFDLQGLGSSVFSNSRARALCQSIVGTMTKLFPESVFKIFVINAPGIFVTTYNFVICYFMDPNTRKKVTILSASETAIDKKKGTSKFIDLMSEFVDMDQIPEYYGGTGKLELVNGDFPAEYYKKDDWSLDIRMPYPFPMPQYSVEGSDRTMNVSPLPKPADGEGVTTVASTD